MDKKELFRFPVTPDVAPDYAEIIDTPMSFADILEKFSLHEYTSLEQVGVKQYLFIFVYSERGRKKNINKKKELLPFLMN